MFFFFRKAVVTLLIFVSVINAQEKVKLSLELAGKKLPLGLTRFVPKDYPQIALALSGGGSRGIAHLGVIKALEESGISVESIIGTSMGSIIGGMYAAGYNISQIDSIVQNANWDSFFSLKESNRTELFVDQKITEEKAIFAVRLNGLTPVVPSSINTGQRVANFLNLITLFAPLKAENNFSELMYDFKAVSTDFKTGDMIILDKGSLSQALRASSSVSLLLPPIKKDSMLLVDGGLVCNIPVKPARANGADVVIASNTSSPLLSEEELVLPWKIADQMVSIPMKHLNEEQLKEADVVVEPNIGVLKNTDFSKMPFLIEEGYRSAKQNIDLIKAKIKEAYIKKAGTTDVYINNPAIGNNANELEKAIYASIKGKDIVSGSELLYLLAEIYMKGDLESAYIEIIPGSSGSVLNTPNIIKVIAKENPEVKTINLAGITLIEKTKGEKIFAPLKNKPYNSSKLLKCLLEMLSVYRFAGYPSAAVKNVEFDEKTGALNVQFDEVKISEIEVTGNTKTQSDIIKREFVFENGNITFNAIQNGLVNLRATNIFDEVEVYPHIEKGVNKLKVDVKEKLSTVLRLGLRIDTEYLTQVSVDLRDENFLGTAAEMGFIFSGGLRNRSFMLEHKANRVFDSYLTYKLKAFYDLTNISVYGEDTTVAYNRFRRNKTGEYSQTSYGVSVGLGTQVGRFGTLMLETKYHNDQIKDNGDYTGTQYKIGILNFRLGFSIDSQNKYPFPTEGFLVKGYYETAQSVLGGGIGYTKLYFDYKNTFSPTRLSTFAVHFVIGAADNTLPLSQNFSLGGQNSFYGFREFEFRGRQIFLASVEYRFMLPFSLFFDTYIKARYDLGSIWTEKEQIRFKDLRHGIGASLAFDTPIGPAEFSVGESFYFKNSLANNTMVWGPLNLYFSIGYSF